MSEYKGEGILETLIFGLQQNAWTFLLSALWSCRPRGCFVLVCFMYVGGKKIDFWNLQYDGNLN